MTPKPKSLRVAVATAGDNGLEDSTSHACGRSKTFTIVDIEDGRVKGVEVTENPAASLSRGRGPVAAKHLADMKVNMVISGELGPGALTMLNELKIKTVTAEPGQRVVDVLRDEALIKY